MKTRHDLRPVSGLPTSADIELPERRTVIMHGESGREARGEMRSLTWCLPDGRARRLADPDILSLTFGAVMLVLESTTPARTSITSLSIQSDANSNVVVGCETPHVASWRQYRCYWLLVLTSSILSRWIRWWMSRACSHIACQSTSWPQTYMSTG